ncbi:MAG: hypothetical protein AABY10_01010 [Nanoarchaeota archaeon]
MIYTLNLLTKEWQQFFTEEQAQEYVKAKPQATQHEYTILFNLTEKMVEEHKISELQNKLSRRNMQIKELKKNREDLSWEIVERQKQIQTLDKLSKDKDTLFEKLEKENQKLIEKLTEINLYSKRPLKILENPLSKPINKNNL